MVKAYPIYYGRRQRGYGIGGLFKNLLKRGAVSVGKRALQAGVDAINQASTSNVSLVDALKQQAKSQIKGVISDVINSKSKKQKSPIKNTPSERRTPLKQKVTKKSKVSKKKKKNSKVGKKKTTTKNKSKQIVL